MLQQTISEDLKEAMKARDEARVSALRMLLAAVRNKEIALGKKDVGLSDDEVLQAVRTEVKKRKEAADEYKRADRAELADKESSEAELLGTYLPAEISDGELSIIAASAVRETNAASEKDFGAVMKVAMAAVQGRASGDRVANAVRRALQGE